jgi:hypothetical protein
MSDRQGRITAPLKRSEFTVTVGVNRFKAYVEAMSRRGWHLVRWVANPTYPVVDVTLEHLE